MKALFIKTMAYSMLLLLFASCKKDENKVVSSTGTAPALTTTQGTLVLIKANAANPATALTWTASSFGYSAGVSYALQIDSVKGNFASPVEIALSTALTKSFTVDEINKYALQLGLNPGFAGNLIFRTKASITNDNTIYAPAYSNTLTLSINPYGAPTLYVPGNYPNGTFDANIARIVSVSDNNNYEGYVYFPTAGIEYKFTPQTDLSHFYGSTVAGTLLYDGGASLKITEAGYYLLKANTSLLTYSATKTTWAIIGDAAGSWGVDSPMTYDVANKVWTITKVMVPGAFKFRANSDWNMAYGDNKVPDGKLVAPGENISVTSGGTYKITMKLSVPGNYTYTINKQ